MCSYERAHTKSLTLLGYCLMSMVWGLCTDARAAWWIDGMSGVWWSAARTAGISLGITPSVWPRVPRLCNPGLTQAGRLE